MSVCKCESSLWNLGFECSPLIGASKKLLVMPLYGSDGTLNFIDLTANLNEAFWTALLNAALVEDRLFPLPDHKNGTSDRADDTFETFDDNTKISVQEGIRSNTILIGGKAAVPAMVGRLKNLRCAEFGIIIVDKNRSIIGSSHGEEGKLYPIAIDSNSWAVKLILGKDKDSTKIQVSFDWSQSEVDEELIFITSDEIAPVNPLTFQGLHDVVSEHLTPSSDTSITVSLFHVIGGTAINRLPVKNLTRDNFVDRVGTVDKLYNATTHQIIDILTFTEDPKGTYTITFAAQAAGDIMEIRPKLNGFDFSAVLANTVVIGS